MGPLDDVQISISPIFYATYVDAYGPVKGYTIGHSMATRRGVKNFDLYLVIFCCAATGTCNIQCMVGGKDVGCFLEVFNRFFAEACVPKIFLPDKDGAILKIMKEGEIDLMSLEGVLSKERGVIFRTCSAQDHSAHGRVEARIKMIQKSLERSSIKNEKLHGLGWQTLCKLLEREINSVPLGYLQHQTEHDTLLRVLTPNSLKLNTCSNRAPAGMFTVPKNANKLFSDIKKVYKFWYEIWITSYLPLIAQMQKWHDEEPNLQEGDVIYFKLKDSKMGQKWTIGKVEYVEVSRDGKVRTVGVSYKYDTENDGRKFSTVQRPVREIVRLFNIEDTFLLEDIANAQKLALDILDSNKIVPKAQFEKMSDRSQPSTNTFDHQTNFGFIQNVLGRYDDPADDLKIFFARLKMRSDVGFPIDRDTASDIEITEEAMLSDDKYDVMLL